MTINNCRVVVSKEYVKKIYNNTRQGKRKFLFELFIYFRLYKLNLDYIPKLLGFSVKENWIKIEYVGKSLDRLYYRQTKKHLDDRILELHNKFKKDTLLFHNDIRYKNVCRNSKNKLFLIDFENCNHYYKDKNHNSILP